MSRQSVAIIDHGDDPDALRALLERAWHATRGIIPESPSGGVMIAPRFGFTRHFPNKRHTGPYCRLRKMPYEFKDQARARLLMDFSGLYPAMAAPILRSIR